MRKFFIGILFILTIILAGCDKWYTTEDVSHTSHLPEFTLTGGEFQSLKQSSSGEYVDPGVTAKSGETILTVFKYGSVDVTKVGVYIIYYSAENSDGLSSSTQRIVAVTDVDVSNNDLSGTYIGTLWDPMETKVKKIDPNGLYKCDEVMGYPGAEMSGKFVDIGRNKLVLINGDGYFGRYDGSEGSYSRSTLSWTIFLIDPPYAGIEIPVVWRKKD